MHVCGIIAEYNPFHTGHAHQIAAARRILGEDCAVVCVLGGNWTQRGESAVADKFSRARLALMGGADLVLELPLPYAVSSAEWFARGGVAVLEAAGVATHLCFGSECGCLAPLERLARGLDAEDFSPALRRLLDQGLSFPAARQRAVEQLLGPVGARLSFPNDNLGVEYLRALARCKSEIIPLAIPRRGAGHGGAPEGGFASAAWLRRLLREGRVDEARPYLLPGEAELLSPLADFRYAERAALYRLRQMSPAELAALPDCGEGLSDRLFRAVRQGTGLEEILALAKTKRYTRARLRRVLLRAFLGLGEGDRPEEPPYLRVLGMNSTGRALLREMKTRAKAPVLTKPAHVNAMPEPARRLFRLEARATDLYGLCFPRVPPCGGEWRSGPVLLQRPFQGISNKA